MCNMTKDTDAPTCHDGHSMHDPGCPYCMGLDLSPLGAAIHSVTGCYACPCRSHGEVCSVAPGMQTCDPRYKAPLPNWCPLRERPLLVRLRSEEDAT